jgi:hypothetical protein
VSSVLCPQVICARFLVGFLGEQEQAAWWPSRFLSAPSVSFLKPVFAKTTLVAQYHGVRDAASAVHDSHIGVGRVFHLFRLPEAVEQRLFTHLLDVGIPEDVGQALTSRETAMARLGGFFKSAVELHGGPLKVGTTEDLHGNGWLSRVAAVYHAAFEGADAPAFPYLVEGL